MSALDEIFNRVLRRSTAALVSGAGYKCKSVRNFVKSYDNCSFSSIVNLKEQYIALCEQCDIRYQSRVYSGSGSLERHYRFIPNSGKGRARNTQREANLKLHYSKIVSVVRSLGQRLGNYFHFATQCLDVFEFYHTYLENLGN